MPSKKKSSEPINIVEHAPADLSGHLFYGLELDPEQKAFRDAIWDRGNDIIFCNAKAGSGKTLISLATSLLLVQYGLFDEVIYMTAGGVHERRQGLLPGDIAQKSEVLFTPVRQAILRLGYDPDRMIASAYNLIGQKDGTAQVSCMTDSYVRGINIGDAERNVIFLIDEAENFTVDGLKTLLSRVNDGSKTIVIGHDKQCDLRYKQDSGFTRALEHFRGHERCAVCSLTKNYRGWVSAWADEL
ncbi:MAG: PhoH family protein [Lachnospiraceae bacterium]|nr:PhoH family protein [Lachnospiraceae bacterium]